jgi:hypothetical protein
MKNGGQTSALRSTVAYLICVTIFPMTCLLTVWLTHLTSTTPEPFEVVRTNPLVVGANLTMYFVLIFMAGFFITALPCVLLHLFVTRYNIRHPLFYVVAGGMLGLLASAAGMSFSRFAPHPSEQNHWYMMRLIPMSCVAGLVYWYAAGRHFGKRTS